MTSEEQMVPSVVSDCGCRTHCTKVLDQLATDEDGSFSCRDRIGYVMDNGGQSEEEACATVSNEFPTICGQGCNPTTCEESNTSILIRNNEEKKQHPLHRPLGGGHGKHNKARTPSASAHVKNWLSKMSLEDKIGQMSQIDLSLVLQEGPDGKKRIVAEKLEHYFGTLGIGSVLNNIVGPQPTSALEYRTIMTMIQEVAQKHNHPPVIWGLDSIHGANYIRNATMTPQPLNLAATFNTTTALVAGQAASRDTRAAGISWLFSPLLGIALEPAWSRVYETFGEDPKLVGDMGSAMIQGIQQQDDKDDIVPSRAAACAKHFVGYSKPNRGHDRSPSWIPTRHLYQYFVPPWRSATSGESIPMTVMESYTETDGVPNVANHQMLQGLLRHQLGFDGVLVTDYSEILNLRSWHHVAATDQEATLHALQQGSVDMSMIPLDPDGFRSAVLEGIKEQSVPMARIDESVKRVLSLKAQLGMMDELLTMDNGNLAVVGQGRKAALDMAQQSIVLVENNNNVLPIDTDQDVKIHVTGPTSASLRYQSGGWTGQWQGAPTDDDWFSYGTTVVEAMGSTSEKWHVTVSCGVDILGKECSDKKNKEGWSEKSGIVDTVEHWIGLGDDDDDDSKQRAADQASHADYVVVCVGEEAYAEKPGDVRSLALPDGQYELVRSIKKTGKKVVLVYFGGRPRLLGDMVDHADAVLIGFLPGPDAGRAVANLIAGMEYPSGRLPVTYPKFEDGAGAPYFHAVSEQCTQGEGELPHWDYVPCAVQWPFGHGKSYTTFEYSDLVVSTNKVQYRAEGQRRRREKKIEDTLTVSVNVKNTGSHAGSEVVLFFTFDESRQVTPENKLLRAFEKVNLQPGETKSVSASVHVNDLRFVGAHDDQHYILQNGLQFRVGVGPHSECRGENPTGLCSEYVTIDAGEDYRTGACDAACTIWAGSGCGDDLHLSPAHCWSMCTGDNNHLSMSVDTDGWGWNYVNCIESVVQAHGGNMRGNCWKMNSLCRNILSPSSTTTAAAGPVEAATNPSTASVVAALLAAMVGCTAIVVTLLRGSIVGLRTRSGWRKDEGDISFTVVRSRCDSEEDPFT